jgi:4-carboxymuconolactone decarboxylase
VSPAHERLVAVSAALAARDAEALEEALGRAAREGDGSAVEEVLLQSYLFLGYPAALNAFGRWRRISGREPGPAAEDAHRWPERGEAVCEAVYGGQYQGLRANIRSLHPDMERWMVEEGYGKVLGRPGLELPVRELCIVALLAVLDAPRQLYSHLRGALNVGASPEAVDETLELAGAHATAGARERAGETWAQVRARWEQRGGSG